MGILGIIRKYGFVSVLAFAVICVYAPLSLEEVAKLSWLDQIDQIGAMLSQSLAPAKPEVGGSPVDPIAAANVDEDLDFRIAQRTKSTEAWRSFLAAHPSGPHAQAAGAELDRLVRAVVPPQPTAARTANVGSPDLKRPGRAAALGRDSQPPEVAKLASDEICRSDEDRLQRLSKSPTNDEALRFVTELRCEKLRPE
jgi:hypothetical protein